MFCWQEPGLQLRDEFGRKMPREPIDETAFGEFGPGPDSNNQERHDQIPDRLIQARLDSEGPRQDPL